MNFDHFHLILSRLNLIAKTWIFIEIVVLCECVNCMILCVIVETLYTVLFFSFFFLLLVFWKEGEEFNVLRTEYCT